MGGLLGAFLSWRVSIGVENRGNRRRLRVAIEIVVTELREDQRRLESKAGVDSPSKDAALQELHLEQMTLGDWAQNKGTLADLAEKEPDLWKDLAHMYGRIYAAMRWPQEDGGQDDVHASELEELANRLEKAKPQPEISTAERIKGVFRTRPSEQPRQKRGA